MDGTFVLARRRDPSWARGFPNVAGDGVDLGVRGIRSSASSVTLGCPAGHEDEWIPAHRHQTPPLAADDQATLDLALEASRKAVADAGMEPADIDEIVLATDTPEMLTPDTAALVQHGLGCRNIPTYDLGGSGCAGFVQALDVAASRIATGTRNVLVVGVEVITRLISLEDRSTAVLFGDGAGAVSCPARRAFGARGERDRRGLG